MKYFLIILFLILSIPSFAKNPIKLTYLNHCVLNEDVDELSINNLKKCVSVKNTVNRRNIPFYIVINSQGGYLKDGLNFINFISKYKNIHTITLKAQSMAFCIVQAISGTRYIIPKGTMMTHPVQIGKSSKSFKYQEFINWVNDKKLISDNYHNIILTRSKINPDFYYSKIDNPKLDDMWDLTDEDAIKYNFADEIIGITCSDELKKKRTIKIFNIMFGDLFVTGHQCPTIPGYIQ